MDEVGAAEGEREAPAPGVVAQTAEAHVLQLRRKLLDLRTGNRLLHFPHSERSKNYARVIDELPELLFEKLEAGKHLRVLPLPAASEEQTKLSPEELARQHGLTPSFALAAVGEQTERRHADDAIQTLLPFEQHQKTMLKLAEATRSMQEEQGIHTLFAAFGFLEWYEDKASELPRYSPLLLYPLALERVRTPAAYAYSVSAHDEEISTNLALAERLLLDFDLQLPSFVEGDDLARYFARLTPLLGAMPRWKLHRWVTLSNFSFARIAMYHDLSSERWPSGEAPHAHRTFRALTSDRSGERNEPLEQDEDHLAFMADELSSLILDADTSQVAAILEAFKDRNLVIKGPPGTGKSQTIANLIATALFKGQRVLFVAEKMAALEVVKARLDGAGLGAFCLELHSHRATRKAVMESIAARLAVTVQAAPEHEGERSRVRKLRTRLNAYAAALNAPVGSLGMSVHDAIWRREAAVRELEAHLPVLDKLRLPAAGELQPAEVDATRHTLRGFQQAAREQASTFAQDPESLWRSIDRPELDEPRLLAALDGYQASLTPLHDSQRGLLAPTLSAAQLHALAAWGGALSPARELNAAVLPALATDDAARTLLGILQLVTRRRTLVQALASSFADVGEAQRALEPLRAAAKSLVTYPTGTSLAALRGEATAQSERCQQLASHGERVTRLLLFVGLEQTHDPEVVLAFREALELLEQAPRELLFALRQNPALLAEDGLSKLRSLQTEALPLLERRSQLDARIVRTQHADELRTRGADYALALQRPWWLAWLYGLYWTARSLHRRLAVRPGSKASEMASDLLEASRLLHELDAYSARDDARRLLAGSFAGVDTDFALLEQAAAWARKVAAQFTRLHPAYPPLRKLLLVTELEQVSTLLTEARLLPLAPLWELAARAQRSRFSVPESLDNERRLAEQTLRGVEVFEQLGARAELTVGELGSVIAQLDELTRAHVQLESARATLLRLGLPEEPLALDVPALEDTVRAAAWAREHALPLSTLAALSVPAQRAAILAELAPRLVAEQTARSELESAGFPRAGWARLQTALPLALAALEHALSTRHLLRAQQSFLREQKRALASYASGVVQACVSAALPLDKLLAASDYVLYQSLLSAAFLQTPSLSDGNGSELGSVRAQFRELDRKVLALNAQQIASQLSLAVPPEGVASGKKSEWSELALIRHELSKRMRHVPLRQLLRRAGTTLGVLKPCFMMSPLSVAQYLPQLADQFDLVVIDEASQMRPEDAVGSIVRARRAVVVGDPKQLPPTSFFQRIERPDEDAEEEADEAIDAESILDLGLASFGSTTDLRWHYRSRHPSLIAFSNQHFYEGRLKVFPAANEDRSQLGVELVRVAGTYESSTNLIEAQAIAARVQQHVHQRPQLSLGVAAMNQKQKDLILEQLAALNDELVRGFVDAEQSSSAQPFFVKSLENVQGDERDVIFVSMTYGPEPTSKRVYQRFGPLNSAHGARRLNVLLTRARQQLVVFSSLSPGDILVDERSSAGLKSLRSYLLYAESGQLSTQARNAGQTESPFEDAVRSALGEAGYEVVPQVGVQGFFIDLGLRLPGQTSFVCGIECDGASYHQSRSARDRDRLRQDILEAQGWRIVRVWSTDWFREPKLARARLLQQIEAAVQASTASAS